MQNKQISDVVLLSAIKIVQIIIFQLHEVCLAN